MRSRKKVGKILLNMKANELTIREPFPNTITKSKNLVDSPTNKGGRMEEFNVPIIGIYVLKQFSLTF